MMISGKKGESPRSRSINTSSQSTKPSTTVINFSDLQKTKKLEAAKRRVYAVADNLNW